MGVLILFHYVNFEQGSLFRKQGAEEPKFASVMPNEYSRFDTSEIYKATSTDKSRTFLRSSEKSSYSIQNLDVEDGGEDSDATLRASLHSNDTSCFSP